MASKVNCTLTAFQSWLLLEVVEVAVRQRLLQVAVRVAHILALAYWAVQAGQAVVPAPHIELAAAVVVVLPDTLEMAVRDTAVQIKSALNQVLAAAVVAAKAKAAA